MGESRHTQGPWVVLQSESRFAKRAQVGSPSHEMVIADVFGTEREREANARLIAAAPTMLEALLEAEDFLFNLPGEDVERSELLVKLRSAISKAGAKVADTSRAREGR